MDHLQQLQQVEKDVVDIMNVAGDLLHELSKQSLSADLVQEKAAMFTQSLHRAESAMLEQLDHLWEVSTNLPYEGSSYDTEKRVQNMAAAKRLVKNDLLALKDRVDSFLLRENHRV